MCILLNEYQSILGYKQKSQIAILLILIIVVETNTNFFRNFIEVILYKFNDLIIEKYGFY